MNLANLSPLAFSATLFLALSLARAQAPAPETPLLAPPSVASSALSPEEAEVLRRYDRNGDGRLDEAERMEAHLSARRDGRIGGRIGQAVYARLLQTFDRGHRGALSPEEQFQAVAYLQAERPVLYQALLRRFDRDRDGRLDPGETAALFRGLERRADGPRRTAKQ